MSVEEIPIRVAQRSSRSPTSPGRFSPVSQPFFRMGREGLEPSTLGFKVACQGLGPSRVASQTASYRRFSRPQGTPRPPPVSDGLVPTLFPPPSVPTPKRGVWRETAASLLPRLEVPSGRPTDEATLSDVVLATTKQERRRAARRETHDVCLRSSYFGAAANPTPVAHEPTRRRRLRASWFFDRLRRRATPLVRDTQVAYRAYNAVIAAV